MAYSKDYRQMILSKLEEGDSFRELAAEYQLSPATIQRWKKNPERKQRVFRPLKIDNQKLIEDVATYPD
ncbi:IS630 transposase-related protein, partial [Psychrobacter sp. 5A.1]|uniref:IS630 transposase-related protein n=1 Tax=Psychrobacter sp. 5A.1 TaxID=3035207 RepID=UPI0025B4704B